MELAGLPVHKRRSNKNKLILGAGPSPQQVLYYKDPDTLVERLQLLVTSKRAGNTCVSSAFARQVVEIFWTRQTEANNHFVYSPNGTTWKIITLPKFSDS